MNKSEKKYAMIAGGVIIVFLLVAQMGYLTQYGIKPFFQQTSTGGTQGPTIDETMRSNYLNGIGVFQLNPTVSDSLNTASGLVFETNLNLMFYHFIGGQWIHELTYDKDVTTNYFQAKPEDNGFMYIATKAVSGQAYYVDYQKIVASDSYIKGYQYVDVDGDSAEEFVFQYDLKNHAIPSSGYPVIPLKVYLLTYDSGVTLTGAANQTGWGTSTVTKFFENYVTISAEKKAIAVYKIEVKLNQTDETLVALKSMTVPGLGKIDKNSFTKTFTSSDIRWTYTFTTSFDGALYLTRPVGSIGKLYFTCEYEATLTSGKAVEMDLTLYYLIAPTEAGSSIVCWNTATAS
jgi:hypothetical protein